MGELVYSRHHGEGLVVAEFSADERAVQAALKDFDRTLRLTWERDGRTGKPVWNVVAVWSPDHPAVQVLTWRDPVSLEPRPLTMSLVEEVKRLRHVDTMRQIDAANAKLKAAADKDAYNDTYEVISDFDRLDRSGRVHVPVKTKRFGAGSS